MSQDWTQNKLHILYWLIGEMINVMGVISQIQYNSVNLIGNIKIYMTICNKINQRLFKLKDNNHNIPKEYQFSVDIPE